ncbi:MAG: hypothetical protein MUF00_15400 [Gemmatimonadaceae bacterium]|jgi:hypothetical protein|nr:hypothetical protein [Gemmatimonadaceae bacterium]
MTAQHQAEAIWEAMTALGGERTIAEVTDWIEARYPGRWKSAGTPMADLTYPGSASSQCALDERCLDRTDRGTYRIRQRGVFRVGTDTTPS